AAGYSQTAVKRSYGYDKTGNLLHSTDQRTGTTHFEYDKLGRITQADDERFAFDPAHNILSTNGQTVSDGLNAVTDNRIKHYNGISYYYDDLGNLIHRELPNGEVQNYFYDLHDQLVKVEIFKKDGNKETWVYRYDALGRRISKGYLKTENTNEVSDRHSTDHACLKTENGKDILDSEIAFLWDGSHLLQEHNSDGLYTYIYTDADSYEPLAQVCNWTNEEETEQSIHYFHCDQIGIPREMTDKDGNLLWFGDYYGWGKLKSETNVTETAHQPFRLQNQYCDEETGLHYNFLRYYEPDCGRFVNQDPIGLLGGMNLYQFSFNAGAWVDFLGLCSLPEQVKHNSTDLSKAVMEARRKAGDFSAARTNYAAAKITGIPGIVVMRNIPGGLHSEERLVAYAKEVGGEIEELYSERKPCNEHCGPLLKTSSVTRNTKVTYTYKGSVSKQKAELQKFLDKQAGV
ncbi:RHS repeat-associated core domain-containing protein, partial [Neisseria dumasiana]|uniref:RHS repeat-associated core domain-containing protein n=1 Tax=Neisseria dumasiana TaxID=1931275 RepID=UPI0015D85A97